MLALHVDGVVVCEVGRISRAALSRARVQLQNVGCKLLGVVLNKVRPRSKPNPATITVESDMPIREKRLKPQPSLSQQLPRATIAAQTGTL